MKQIDLSKFQLDIKDAKKNIIKDIQKYSFTTFKRVFRPKVKLKAQMLSGLSRQAFEERLKLNKRTKGSMKGLYKQGSEPGNPPRQDPRKFLSNNVRYIDDQNSAIVILNVPFGKQLDQGGSIKVKQYKTPYDWMRLDKLIYDGITYFGRVLKVTKKGSLGMKISQDARMQYTTKKAKITWFNSSKAIVKRYNYLKSQKTISIKPRPFIDVVLNSIIKSGRIEQSISKRLAKIKI